MNGDRFSQDTQPTQGQARRSSHPEDPKALTLRNVVARRPSTTRYACSCSL